ncbi:hypothetical protein BWR15_00580 [Pseudomonas sp. T]|nr:hypothetical protein BWR15_00580 [Pseudomonas sp. T]
MTPSAAGRAALVRPALSAGRVAALAPEFRHSRRSRRRADLLREGRGSQFGMDGERLQKNFGTAQKLLFQK